MNIYLTLFLITVIVVNLIDLSGFIHTLKHWIWKWVWKNKRPYQEFDFRPFECSYCMTHWVGLIYLLISKQWTLPTYTVLLLLCFITPIIKDIILTTKDILQKIIDTIYEYLGL